MVNQTKMKDKVLMTLLTLLMATVFGMLILPLKVQASQTVTSGDYTYTITDGTAVLTKYNGTSTSVTIPTSVTYNGVTYKIRTIGEKAFEGNAYIQKLVIPEEITKIEAAAFKNCTSLSSITIEGNIGDCNSASANDYGNVYTKYSVFYNAGANVSSLTVTFGDSVTYVPAYLFSTASSQSNGKYCHVTAVVFSNSVAKIGAYAFYRCYDLSSITWGSGLTTISEYAFEFDSSIKSLYLPEKVAKIEKYAFMSCTGLLNVVLPESLTTLEQGAFKNCTSLSSITINGNIGSCNSASANSYGGVYANYSVFYNAGANADSLTVTFGDTVTSVAAYLFATASSRSDGYYAHVTSVKFSNGVTKVGAHAFYRCYDLKSISWGSGITEIADYAFAYNSSIQSINLPDKLTTLGECAFESCSGCSSLTIPKSVVSFDKGVFKNCTSLSSITINGDIGDGDSNSSNKYVYSDYALFYNAGANSDSLTVTFGSAVTCIPAYLFATGGTKSDNDYAHITSVNIASKATKIGNYAFYHCYDLETVTLNCNGLTIGGNSFGDVTATVYYPTPNSSWTSDLRTNYGGTLTWKSKFMSASKMAFSSVANATNGVKLSWSKVSAATGYKIYRKTGSGSYSLLKTITSNSTVTYTDTTVSSGTSYTYYIQAYTSSVNSSYTTKSIMHLGKCSVSYVCNTMDGLKAAWNKVTGASGYYVYRRNNDGTYSTTPTATVTSGSTTNWTDTSTLTGGKSYTYKVVAYYKNSSGAVTLGAGATTKTCMYLKGGAVSSVANTSTGLKVTWSKVAGANGYQVYRKVSGGDYSLVKTVSGGSTLNWTDTSASDGKTYTYKVSPIYTNTSGQVTKGGAKTTKTCVRLTAPSISSLTNSASKTMLVKWGKKSGVTGYQIQYSTSSTFASGNKTVTVTGASSLSKTIASLTKNKTYYVRIRTYKTVSGTSYYSVWSAKKSVKITK